MQGQAGSREKNLISVENKECQDSNPKPQENPQIRPGLDENEGGMADQSS